MAERISTPSKTKEIIEANRFAFKKNFGQNFLIDSNILDNIAACAGVTKEDCVLEIGPGIGSLTQVLGRKCRTGGCGGNRQYADSHSEADPGGL